MSTLSAQLSWSHFTEILPIKDPLARDFYAEMCRIERWDVRTFRKKIGLILCAAANAEQVGLFQLDDKFIRDSEYLTEPRFFCYVAVFVIYFSKKDSPPYCCIRFRFRLIISNS